MKHSTKKFTENAETFLDVNPEVNHEEGALVEMVDDFAREIKKKLLAQCGKGRKGWDDPKWDVDDIEWRMYEQVMKVGVDPIDVAAFAVFLWNRCDEVEADIDFDRTYVCPNCGITEMSKEEYAKQLDLVDRKWYCGECNSTSILISDTFGEYPEATAAALRAVNQLPLFPQPAIDEAQGESVITAEGTIGYRPNLEEQAENIRKQIREGE